MIALVVAVIFLVVCVVPLLALIFLSGQIDTILSSIGNDL
jgi:hypothetical protein